uniref:Uncharacterized protein n=1 Tax=Arundo donax TaxID=35708 RepID=A0A0A9BWE5_ARUDO
MSDGSTWNSSARRRSRNHGCAARHVTQNSDMQRCQSHGGERADHLSEGGARKASQAAAAGFLLMLSRIGRRSRAGATATTCPSRPRRH